MLPALVIEALWAPAVLALGVLTVNEIRPDRPVLAVIAGLAPLVTAVTLLVRDGNRALAALQRLVSWCRSSGRGSRRSIPIPTCSR